MTKVQSRIRLGKEPHAQQQKFIDCTAEEQLYGGAKRGGKSVALCQKIILLAYFFPGNRILLCRKDFTDLWDTTLNEFKQICPAELYDTGYGSGTGWNKGDREIRLRTIDPRISSSIIYRGLGEAGDVEKAKSLTIGCLAIDEPSEVPFETYKMLRSQLQWVLLNEKGQPSGKRPPYMALLASNPEPGWVKDRFIDPELRASGTAFIPALPRDNPYLPEGWESTLRDNYDLEWVHKYLDGSWDVTEGSTFPTLSEKIHNCPDLNLSGMSLFAAIDHATTGRTAMVCVAVDANANRYAIGEYYETDKLISYSAKAMIELQKSFVAVPDEVYHPKSGFKYTLIDPSTTAKTLQGANKLEAVADIYRQNGINVIPAWNALEAGLDRVKQALTVVPTHIHPFLRHPNGNPILGSPHLFINKRRCPSLWKEMRDHKKVILPTGGVKFVGLDHALDCYRYIENSQPKLPILAPSDKLMVPMQEQFMDRAHRKWMAKFGKSVASQESWYKGIAN